MSPPKKPRREQSLSGDPHRAREARHYENPIPSREYLLAWLREHGAPAKPEEFAEAFGLSSGADRQALDRRLEAMGRAGQLILNRRGAWCRVNDRDLVRGRVIAHPDGFGFLKPDEGGEDLSLSAREMRALLHGDRIVARVAGVDRRGRREAAVVEVIERSVTRVVGRLHNERGACFLVPDNPRIHHDILIGPNDTGGARAGQIVVAELVEAPSRHGPPVGRVVELLGDHMAPGMEIEIAIRAHALPHEWPDAVVDEMKAFGTEVPEAAKAGREDLRELPLVTIDGEDARDFDDAVWATRTRSGFRLIVAIADVSSYVEPGTALDREAYSRGNSVYFPDRVIPMLPEVLSNGLCSLNPKVDRLCLCCEARIDGDGSITRTRFFEGVMRSHARLTYSEVEAMLVRGDHGLRRKYSGVVAQLDDLNALYQVLRTGREKRGAIDFSSSETRIVFDAERKIDRIEQRERLEAHRLIEECMLVANVSAARFLLRRKMGTLFRIHEQPDADRVADTRRFLGELGLRLPGGELPTPGDYARLIARIQERPDVRMVETVLLRSMMQAVYSPDNVGHFGLAYEEYLHFTSPIRRYPDLLVHRAIRHLLRGGKPGSFGYNHDRLLETGEHCSMTERRADEATRDAVNWLKCEYMLAHVGEEYAGTISAVTSFGLFVELDGVYVEGLVHITNLRNDYYHFDPVGHRLEGERSGEVFRLADRVRVKVARVDLEERKIDFELLEHGSSRGGAKPARKDKPAREKPARRGKRDKRKRR
ncbi:MAG: ribonuclease R [Chromatiales bacterium]|nr:ribonuclease R [Chromatiales bacterium]